MHGCCCIGGAIAGVRIGCYANGFQTTTTQWLQGAAAEGLLSAPDPVCLRVTCVCAGVGVLSLVRRSAGILCFLSPRVAGDYDAQGTITPAAYARHAAGWLAAGASIIGGCCGVGPEHMQRVAVLAAQQQQQQDDAAGREARRD